METTPQKVLSQQTPIENDILNSMMLNEDELHKYPRAKKAEEITKSLNGEIENLVKCTERNGKIFGAIMILIMLGKDDEEILNLVRPYFVKYVTPSISDMQIILRDVEELETLPNDGNILRYIKVLKELCIWLIGDFGRRT
jgi:hypothetical protein